MTTTYHTRNSLYEVDEDAKRARRVTGTGEPTPQFHQDGEWQDFERFIPDGGFSDGLVFVWSDGTWTITSPVVVP